MCSTGRCFWLLLLRLLRAETEQRYAESTQLPRSRSGPPLGRAPESSRCLSPERDRLDKTSKLGTFVRLEVLLLCPE